jgi:4-amino-4-deoxy-L-arabinose transferase-like glycosyltransferase
VTARSSDRAVVFRGSVMSEGKTVAAVFICILALHLLFLYGYQLDNRPQRPKWQAEPDTPLFTIKVIGDEKQFALIAYHLATQNFYSLDGENPTALRMPLFPLLVAVLWKITGSCNATLGIWLNCFLAALIALVSYGIARLFWDYADSIVAMVVVGLNPHTFETFVMFSSEPTYCFFFLLSFYLFIRLMREKRSLFAVGTGVCCGLTTLARAEGALLALIFTFTLICVWRRDLRLLSFPLIVLLSAAAVIAPWLVRNHRSMNFVGLSTMSGEVFSGAHNERILGNRSGSWGRFSSYASPEEIHLVSRMSEVEANKYKWRRAWKTIKSYNPLLLSLVALKRLFNTFRPHFRVFQEGSLIINFLNIILIAPFIILYLLFFIKIRYFCQNYPIFFNPFFVPIIVSLIFWGTTRWRLAVEPLMFMLVTSYVWRCLSHGRPSDS